MSKLRIHFFDGNFEKTIKDIRRIKQININPVRHSSIFAGFYFVTIWLYPVINNGIKLL